MNDIPRPGSNFPPAEERIPGTGREELHARLERDYQALTDRALELEVGLSRLPDPVTSDAEGGLVSDFLTKQVQPFIEEVEDTHEREKGPVLELVREYDDFFLKKIRNKIRDLASKASKSRDVFAIAKRAAERAVQAAAKRRAEEEQRRQFEQAEAHRRAAIEGERAKAAERLRLAKEAEAAAAAQQRIIDEPEAKGHIRGEHGSVTYLRDTWDFRVDDPSQLPWRYIKPNKELIREDIAAAVKRARFDRKPQPGISIPGVSIFQTSKSVARG